VEVPVEGIMPDTLSGWSASSEVTLGVGAAAAVKAVWTVTEVDPADVCVSAREALSDTWSSNL